MKNLIKKAYSIATDLGFRDTLRLIWVILFKWNPPLASEEEIMKVDFLLGFEFDPSPESWTNIILASAMRDYELPSIVQYGLEATTTVGCARNAVVFQGHRRVDSFEVVRQADAVNESLGRPWKKSGVFAYEYQALRTKWVLESMGYQVFISRMIKWAPMNSFSKWGHQWRTRIFPLWVFWEISTRVHYILHGYIDPRIMIQ